MTSENPNKKFDELQRLQNIISQSVLYTTADIDGKITSISKAFEKLTGYTEDELIGQNHSIFRNPDTSKEFYKDMWETLKKNIKFVGELKNYTKHKDIYWTKLTIDPMFNNQGKKIGYAAYRENITNTKKLEYISTHDTLKDIYNREYFNKNLDCIIKTAKRYNKLFSLILLDIDNFKKINDSYGHNQGDKVLIKIAQILKNNIREDDIIARWGGEEFVILLPHTEIDGAYLLAKKLRSIIDKSIICKEQKVTASFGVGTYNQNESKMEFFEKIDKALYQAKNSGKNIVIKA